MTIFRETYTVVYAHSLPSFPEGHKCRAVHGHTANITLDVEADAGENGYAFDHAELDVAVAPALRRIDHHYINDIPGLEDGLAESLLAWLVERFKRSVAPLHGKLTRVELHELSSGSTFRLVDHVKIWTPSAS